MEHQCPETKPLLQDYAAGRLTQSDRQRVELILEDCDVCTATLESIQSQPCCHQPDSKRSGEGASLGQILAIIGFLIFYGTGIKLLLGELIANPETPLGLKYGLPIFLLGIGLLLAKAIAQRWQASKTDKYTNVDQ